MVTEYSQRKHELECFCHTFLEHDKSDYAVRKFRELYDRVYTQLVEAVAVALYETINVPIEDHGGVDEVTRRLKRKLFGYDGTGEQLADRLVNEYHQRHTLTAVDTACGAE